MTYGLRSRNDGGVFFDGLIDNGGIFRSAVQRDHSFPVYPGIYQYFIAGFRKLCGIVNVGALSVTKIERNRDFVVRS